MGPVVRSIGRSSARSIDRSVVRSLARSIVRPFARSIGRPFDRWVVCSLGRSVRSLARAPVRSVDRSVVCSLARSLVRSLGRSSVCSLDRPFARSIDRPLARSIVGSLGRSSVRSFDRLPIAENNAPLAQPRPEDACNMVLLAIPSHRTHNAWHSWPSQAIRTIKNDTLGLLVIDHVSISNRSGFWDWFSAGLLFPRPVCPKCGHFLGGVLGVYKVGRPPFC